MECISVLPGRVRFRSQDIYYNSKLAKYIQKYIHSLYGVKSTSVTENTGSILVLYNINKTNPQQLKENIESALSAPIVKNDDDFKAYDKYFEALELKQKAKRKFLFWSAFYILLKLKGITYGKFPVSRNLNVLKVASVVTIIGGYPLFKRIYRRFAKHVPTDADVMFELVALSFTILRESSKGIMLLVLKALNDYIKFHAEAESRKALIDSYEKNFKMAWTKASDGNDILVSVDSLKVGDNIFVYPGETVPATGIIEEGNAVVNTLYFTGQPIVSTVGKGSEIHEGIAVISGDLKIKITQLPDISGKKDITPEDLYIHNRTKGFEDKMTPIAIGTAALSYIFTGNILNSFSVMLVLSPKASKVSLNSGIKNYLYLLNRHNIYLQNPNTFENILNVNKVVFDKTGTLTYGRMKIVSVESLYYKYSNNDILKICAACEVGNYHPISITLQNACSDFDINNVESSVLIPSKGVKATYNNYAVLIGNKELMEENYIDLSRDIDKYNNYKKALFTPIFVAINNKIIGIIVLNDIVRKDSKKLIDKLKYNNINDITLLTGDSYPKAQEIASQVGITRVLSDKNYQEKAEVIEAERNNGIVMMVGDGINDVLAMKAAHVSVSFANNSCDNVKLHSDCIIYDDEMLKVADLISLSQKSYKAISRTILISNLYNLILGAIAFSGGLNIFLAKGLNTLNSIIVLLLNKRILFFEPGKIHNNFYLEQENNYVGVLN